MGNVVLSPGLKWPRDDLSFEPWVRKGRAKPLFPHMPSWPAHPALPLSRQLFLEANFAFDPLYRRSI